MYFGEEEGGGACFVGFAAEGLGLFEVVGHGGLGAHLSDCLGVVSMGDWGQVCRNSPYRVVNYFLSGVKIWQDLERRIVGSDKRRDWARRAGRHE